MSFEDWESMQDELHQSAMSRDYEYELEDRRLNQMFRDIYDDLVGDSVGRSNIKRDEIRERFKKETRDNPMLDEHGLLDDLIDEYKLKKGKK